MLTVRTAGLSVKEACSCPGETKEEAQWSVLNCWCRVTPNSGTRRIGQRLLPLNITFRRQLVEVIPFPQDNTINRCKKTGLQFERTKHGNSGVPIETSAEHCRLDQWT